MSELLVVLDNIRSAHNVGAVLRSCDIFGVARVVCCGLTPYPELPDDRRLPHVRARAHRQIAKTSLGAEDTVPVTHAADTVAVLRRLRKDGCMLLAIEQDAAAQALPAVHAGSQPLALILGNEVRGVDPAARAMADTIVEIPQLGRKESLNVAAAAAIALYHFAIKA